MGGGGGGGGGGGRGRRGNEGSEVLDVSRQEEPDKQLKESRRKCPMTQPVTTGNVVASGQRINC